MTTLGQLLQHLSAIDPKAHDTEVRLVTNVNVIEQGQFEGGLMLTSRPIAGIALGNAGVLLFVDQADDLSSKQIMPHVPPGFRTGDRAIDDDRKAGEEGEEWKNG